MALKWKTAVIHTPELDLHQHVKTPTVRTVPVTGVFLPAVKSVTLHVLVFTLGPSNNKCTSAEQTCADTTTIFITQTDL